MASSIAAGTTSNTTPAACSIAARAALAEARIRRALLPSGVEAMAAREQFVDGRRSLLDRPPGHIDNRPMLLGEDTAGFPHLAFNRFEIGVIGLSVVIEHR